MGNTTLNKDGSTTVEGDDACQVGKDCHLIINFQTQNVKLDLTVKYDVKHIKGYWEWNSLKIDGDIGGVPISSANNGNGDMIVTPVPGYTTKNKNDINCQRDNTICAPVGLSWTCDDEKFKSKGKTNEVRINFPGLQLQPFFDRNGSTTQALRYDIKFIVRIELYSFCSHYTPVIIFSSSLDSVLIGTVIQSSAFHYGQAYL